MGSSVGSQFLSEYPGGMRCARASASVALGGVGGAFLDELEGRGPLAVDGRCGVDCEERRGLRGVSLSYRGEPVGSAIMIGVPALSNVKP